MATLPWNGADIYLFLADNKTAMDIRSARDGDNKQGVFKASELEDLYATIAGSGFPMKSQNFVLYGTTLREDGRPAHIVPEIVRAYDVKADGKKTGETREGSYAYTAKQLDKFVPVSFIVKTKFIKSNGRNIPVPLFMAHATPFERTATESAAGFQRITAAKVNEPAATETVQRRQTKNR